MATVGDRMKEARAIRKMGRSRLAELSGVGYSTLSEIERGGMQTSTKLRVIADALGVNLRWLETGKGPMEGGAAANDDDWAGPGAQRRGGARENAHGLLASDRTASRPASAGFFVPACSAFRKKLQNPVDRNYRIL